MSTLKVFTTFTGIGMQERGLFNSNKDIEVVGTSEIDPHAIISYSAIHKNFNEIYANYKFEETKREMSEYLKSLNVGYDFLHSRAYDWDKAKLEFVQKVYLACKLNNNYGDISKITNIPDCDIFTFSFPCTDISVSGRQRGIVANKTRSGLVYEVLRILKAIGNKPSILIMENVSALVNKKNISSYEALNKEFLKLGYYCKYKVMNAKDYGVPQNRDRVFAIYMLDKEKLDAYVFPDEIALKVCTNDYLEPLDDKYIINNDRAKEFLANLNNFSSNKTSNTLIYLGALSNSLWLKNGKNLSRNQRQGYRVYSSDGVCPGLATNVGGFGRVSSLIYDVKTNKVRRLSPVEAFKLMGMTKVDCEECIKAGVTEGQLYKQAGNGLVADIICQITNNL